MTQPYVSDRSAHWFAAPDGVRLAWHEMGAGRPVVLLHGLLGNGPLLAGSGPARALAARGYRVILPDLRGHGDSGRPHDPACYPPDVLADDGLALLAHLGLDDYDLGGYSLGGRLVLRLLARGARPARAVVGGQGFDALDAQSSRTGGYRRVLAAIADGGAFEPGSPEEGLAGWVKQIGADPRAIGYVIGSSVATPLDALRQVPVPTLIVAGDRDSRSESAAELAAILPNGQVVLVPGDHESALGTPEFAAAVLDFLARAAG
jgi:pimeloyl-ACP methyl ester carboxylesterase